ncbi:MAG: tripartite tricarboxylate transporter substrate binding protein [Rhodospirillales bacterium]|nr:MAG: tripartite tricarboxylate transporter substrate binding protein [Rhodospirillales bacterium]
MILDRRTTLVGAAAALATAPARAQDAFPSKPLRIVVPFAAGSATDLAGRGLGAKLQEILKQPVVIENKPGASGQLGAQAVATAAPDGYTLLMGTNTTNAANGALFKKLSYDPAKDFAPIARVVMGVNCLVVNPDLPVKTTAELIAYAKANPGKLNYAEASASQRLSAEQFNQLAGVKIERVPYKASPQALGDVVAGQVQIMFPDLPQALAQVQAGKVRALGVTGAKRTSIAPDIPALAEAVPGYELVYWLAVFAPAATPAPVQKRLYDAVAEAMKDEATGRAMTQGRMEVSVIGLAEFGAFVVAETDKWTKAIKAAGIEPE